MAVAALGASRTKSLLVADCIKKLTARSKVNQVTIICVPGHGNITVEKVSTYRLAREGVSIRGPNVEKCYQC